MLPHNDADGLSSGVLLTRRTGGPAVHVASPWEGSLPGPAVVIADWGVRPVSGPEHVLYVDHHAAPEQVSGTVVTPPGGGETSTSMVAWELLGRPPEGAWLAALGAVGDLGPGALKLPGVPRAGSATALRRLASLVTAPSRIRDGSVEDAFRLLAESGSAKEALRHEVAPSLRRTLDAATAARSRAMRTAPQVGGEAALIRFREPARVHALVASAWARRLAPRIVIAANEGWRDGKVSFAVRSAPEVDLRDWLLRRFSPPPGAGDYARGHARATGGSLEPGAFEEFARAALA